MRSIEQMIESQLERWAVERRAEVESTMRPRGRTPAAPVAHPWIALSRDYGSGGTEIAERLAERLGYELFDRKLLDAIAHESQYRREFLASVDEKGRNTVEAHVDALLHGESFVRSDFLRYLMRVVVTIGEHGRAIIVGRGAAHILPPEGGVSVRVVAPFENRVKTIAARLSISTDEARLRVHEVDRSRVDFLKTHFHRGSWSAEDYDLTVNTARMTAEQAANLVVSVLVDRFPEECSQVGSVG